MKSFVAVLFALVWGSTSLAEELMAEPEVHAAIAEVVNNPSNADEHATNLRHRRQCSPSATATKAAYASGEQVQVIINICQSSTLEWFGIYPAGASPATSPAVNWQLTCGGQSCGTPQNVGGYLFGLDGNTVSGGSSTWPLPSGSYVIYYHSAFGSVSTAAFSIGGGSSSPPSVPAAPVTTTTMPPNTQNAVPQLNRPISVACAGDSLTYGRSRVGPGDDYPTQLAMMLGGNFQLYNFGRNAMVAAMNTKVSYDATGQFGGSIYIKPDIYLLMIGTNDVRPGEWNGGFTAGLINMVRQAKAASTRVILAIPPWIQGTAYGITNDNLVSLVIPQVQSVAISEQVQLVDMYSITANQAAYYTFDGLHPNRQGYNAIASVWYSAIQCNQNGICEVGETCSSCPSDCFVNC